GRRAEPRAPPRNGRHPSGPSLSRPDSSAGDEIPSSAVFVTEASSRDQIARPVRESTHASRPSIATAYSRPAGDSSLVPSTAGVETTELPTYSRQASEPSLRRRAYR